MHKRIERALKRTREAEEALDRVVAEVQEVCKHDRIAAAPALRLEGLNDIMPPYAICLDCGQHESGWYFTSFKGRTSLTGSEILSPNDLPKIAREEVYKLRLGKNREKVWTND